jgi:hypothetical protein
VRLDVGVDVAVLVAVVVWLVDLVDVALVECVVLAVLVNELVRLVVKVVVGVDVCVVDMDVDRDVVAVVVSVLVALVVREVVMLVVLLLVGVVDLLVVAVVLGEVVALVISQRLNSPLIYCRIILFMSATAAPSLPPAASTTNPSVHPRFVDTRAESSGPVNSRSTVPRLLAAAVQLDEPSLASYCTSGLLEYSDDPQAHVPATLHAANTLFK